MYDNEEMTEISGDVASFLASMRRTRRGNLWRKLPDSSNATIFPDRFGHGYSWCIAGADNPGYSPCVYPSEQGAAEALLESLEDLDV